MVYFMFWCIRRVRFLRHMNTFKVKRGSEISEEARECSICMQEYTADDNVKIIGCPAEHHFH
jgi:hypothetical protein